VADGIAGRARKNKAAEFFPSGDIVAMDTPTMRRLNDGTEMPLLGLGVWQVKKGDDTERSVRWALELGYRHIDTAQAYGNEESVGRALKASGVPRDQVFITTKFFPRAESRDPAVEAQKSLGRLGIDKIDLYLVHWPQGGPTWAWPKMEEAHARGWVRSIGVSNFSVAELDALLAVAKIKPAVNQVEFGPFRYRRALLEHCTRAGVVLESYSPLNSSKLGDSKVAKIAQQHARSPAQVLLRWVVQHGVPVIPKSVHRERIEENAKLFDFELSPAQMEVLDSLDTTQGTAEAREGKWW
jgi:diketogulonate reductase-like aldo/keto reductase